VRGSEVQFFRVNPVEPSVHEGWRTVFRQPGFRPAGDIDGVQIVTAPEADVAVIRGKFRIELASLGRSQLIDRAIRQMHDEEVAGGLHQQTVAAVEPLDGFFAYASVRPVKSRGFGYGPGHGFYLAHRHNRRLLLAVQVVDGQPLLPDSGKALAVRSPDHATRVAAARIGVHQRIDSDGLLGADPWRSGSQQCSGHHECAKTGAWVRPNGYHR
jgi:hypothetical protein